MAVFYQKKNGFPVNLLFETEESVDIKENWKGFKTKIYLGKKKKLIKEFYHSKYRDRIAWADGFFTALKLKK